MGTGFCLFSWLGFRVYIGFRVSGEGKDCFVRCMGHTNLLVDASAPGGSAGSKRVRSTREISAAQRKLRQVRRSTCNREARSSHTATFSSFPPVLVLLRQRM